MKALVILENHFIRDSNGKVWCNRIIDYEYLKRYLNIFEEIIVCGRFSHKEVIEDKKMLCVSGKNVEFLELPDFIGAIGLLKNYFKIRKLIKSILNDIDCCLMRAPTHLAFVTYDIFIKNNIPFAVEFMMAADKMFEGDSSVKKILNSFLVYKAKDMCKKANGVSYVTDHILQKIYPCHATLYPKDNTYFTESYSSINLPEKFFYEQKWNPNKKPSVFRIIHTGYMDSYRKGQDTLIKAIKIVIDKGYTNIKLVLIGDGNKRKEFEELVISLGLSNYVEFKGLISNKNELMDELKKSNLFVFPTHSEGLPRSIIEAMAVGLPCISSPVDGIPELLDEEYLIDYNNLEGYAEKIIELINNWEQMIIEGKKNYYMSKKYCLENLECKRNEFYKKLRKKCMKGNEIK